MQQRRLRLGDILDDYCPRERRITNHVVVAMIEEALEVEMAFCSDALSQGVTGISPALMYEYLQYVADQRLVQLGFKKRYNAKNPFSFMVLQDVQPLTNFVEKKVTAWA